MKYVAPTMRDTNAVMGGEESGGYVSSACTCPSATASSPDLFFLDLMICEEQDPVRARPDAIREARA